MDILKSELCKSASFIGIFALAPLSVYAEDSNNLNNETVIISGLKPQSIYKSPISISKIRSENLSALNSNRAQDLINLVPALQFPQSENSLSVTARIRGIGTQGTNLGLEPSVGIMIDGIMRSRTAAGFGDLGEIDIIEVARGPQTLLYGANVTAGLINIRTQNPSKDFKVKSFATIGNLNLFSWGTDISGPFNENLSASFGFTTAKRDGYVLVNQGLFNERKDNNIDYYSSRAQLYWEKNQSDARLIIDYSKRAENCCNAAVFISDTRVPFNSTQLINRIFQNGKYTQNQFDDLRAYADRTFDQSILDKGISLEINHNIGEFELKSISGIRYFDFSYGQDGEWSGADILYRDIGLKPGGKTKDFTQEFRITGKKEKIDWAFGANYRKQEINSHNVFQYGRDYETYIGGLLSGSNAASIPVSQFSTNLRNLINSATGGAFNINLPAMVEGGGWSDYFNQKFQSYSLFASADIELTGTVNLIVGLRTTKDEKEFSAQYFTTGANGCNALEQFYGFNPSANAPSNFAGIVGTVCVPWARSALDGKNHTQKFTDNNTNGNIAINYKLSNKINAYASLARGHKSGGFNLDRVMQDKNGTIISGNIGTQTIRMPDTSFPAETVNSYEIGIKGRKIQGVFDFALSVFNAQFKNFQLNTYNGISQIVASVPEVNSKGIELDYSYNSPIAGLNITGGIAFNDTEYTKNLGVPNDPNSFLGQNLNLYLIGGQQLTASPKYTYVTNLVYDTNLSGLSVRYTLNNRISSSYNGGSNLDPRKTIPGLSIYNASVFFKPNNSNWSFTIWGKNLGDEHYAQIIFDGPLQGNSPLMSPSGTTRSITSQLDGFPAEPRTFGLTIRWNK